MRTPREVTSDHHLDPALFVVVVPLRLMDDLQECNEACIKCVVGGDWGKAEQETDKLLQQLSHCKRGWVWATRPSENIAL